MMIARPSNSIRSVNPWLGAVAGAALCVLAAAASAQEKSDPPVVPPDNGAHVAVTPRGTVELHVADLPLATVLQMLSLESKRNIVASPKVQGKVTANLYDVTFEEALQAVLAANNAGFRQAGNFIYVYTADELAELAAATGKQPFTRVFPLSYITAADAQSYITPLLGKDGTVAVSPQPTRGLQSQSAEAGGDANAARDFIVVTAPPENMREIERVLRETDVRPRQVLVEATILRAQLSDDNALGIDFSVVGGVDLEGMGAVSNGIRNVSLGNLPKDRFEKLNSVTSTDFTSNVPSGGVTIGIIKDKVGAFLRALEDVTDTSVLANPKILALNKQKGQVIVGRRDGYLTTTVTETQAVQTVQFLETGTQLIFRPFIADDGYVRVELHPEDSVGFVNAQGLPSEQTTEVTTNVIIRDGETILIGGLFRELTTDARSQIPGLGNIPGVGQLFRSNNDSSSREEVIILLTMHIVKDQTAYADASKQAYEDIERTRIGLRQGLMRHGRERLAQSNYQRAVQAADAGDLDRALWYTDMSIRCNSRHLSAIRLKEKILGKRAWEEDGAAARSFIHELIAKEKGYPLPMFDRPAPEVRSQSEPGASATGQSEPGAPATGQSEPRAEASGQSRR